MHLLRGREAILGSKPILDELARLSDQTGALNDLAYHLSSPYTQKNPCLMLIEAGSGIGDATQAVGGFVGAMLLFEYKVFGVGLRLFTSGDTTGRRTLIAPSDSRARIAAHACRALLADGAQIVLTSFQRKIEDNSTRCEVEDELRECATWPDDPSRSLAPQARWAVVERTNPLYLALEPTFDATLARIGRKTRTNLRYYRRRAVKELGCSFVPEVTMGLEEFLAFNRECTYAVTDEMARWRYESLATMEHPFLQGVRDGNGRWLSLAGGRRTGNLVELEWQCNRSDLPASSLSTVMRTYLIEHEVGLGMKRLYFEGGTPSSLQQSFVVEGAADLTMYRQSVYVWIVRKLAGVIFPGKNYLAQMLNDRSLRWEKC